MAAHTNKQEYGKNFYRVIGALGGSASNTGGFAAGPEGRERARKYGRIGGQRSRNNRPVHKPTIAEKRQQKARVLLRDLKADRIDYHEYMRLTQLLYDY